jgi:hypothetical protein
MVAVTQTPSSGSSAGERYSDNKLKHDIRMSNMNAAKKLADAIRTSLGPRGMDKMLVSANNDVTITNDGATILNKMEVTHPAAKMLVELAKSQDIAAGDGTTSVTVLCGSLLNKCIGLLERGVHPTVISDAMGRAGYRRPGGAYSSRDYFVGVESRRPILQRPRPDCGGRGVEDLGQRTAGKCWGFPKSGHTV